MSTKTNVLQLVKPDYNENADINVINSNMDILDNEFSNLRNRYLPLTGGTLTGTLNGTNVTLSGSIANSANDNGLYISGGTSWSDGASCYLYGQNYADKKGLVELTANNGTNNATMTLYPNGNIGVNKYFSISTNGKASTYYNTDGTVGMNNGSRTLELNADNNLYFNGGKIAKIFNIEYSDLKMFDVSNKSNDSYLVQGEYSLQIFQDKQSLWTEMYVMVWSTAGDKWFKFKSPITWKNQESTFVVTSLGSIKSSHTFYENTCYWVDNNTFYMFSRGKYCQMYHFAGYAMTLFDQTNTADLFKIDETTERMTVQTNAKAELEEINANIQELQVASVSGLSSTDEQTYTVMQSGNVLTLNDDKLNELHTNLVNRRSELLEVLKNGQKSNNQIGR